MNPDTLTIIIDTREQLPLAFSLPTARACLGTGDYSLKGLEDAIAIERKSADDLVACLKNDQRERFERELARGRDLAYFALVIEADLVDLVAGKYQSRMSPKSVIQSLLALSIRYRLPIFFCPNRRYAARLVESLLLKFHRALEKQKAA